jgi:signal transduction histidine kinase
MRGLLAALALALLAPDATALAAAPGHQVLVVYSTRRDAQVALVGERDLPRLIEEGLGGRLDYYAEFIDPARFGDPAYQSALAEFLRLKYVDHRFDLVVSIGDDALKFVGSHRDVFDGSPPLVFYGTSARVSRPANATGVVAEVNLAGSVALASTLDPDLAHVFVVNGSDGGDVQFEKLARAQLARFAPRLDIVYLIGLPSKELDGVLRSLPAHSAVYYLAVNQDKTGQYFHPLQYLDRVVAAAGAPTYSWVDSTMGRGVVGGSLKSQSAQMAAVAGAALRVLRGEAADSVPVAVRDLNVVQVDWRQLKRWGLSESTVPQGATVLFRDPTLLERYRPYVLTALVLLFAQTVLIALLLVQRARRRRAEARLIESQGRLRASYERIRDLGARLLHSQETERAYIARELHDDVSQQLALIEMDVKLLGSGGNTADRGFAAEALTRVQETGRSIRELSHRLHPARLRLIGLVGALNGLQAEVSHSGIQVTFTHENIPASLPPDLTLCLFRVAQETLQNAIKYSKATRVDVRLAGTPGALTLTAVDDGVGFDVGGAWSRGLGLLSMRERVEAIGGGLRIDSTPGAGTRLEVTVPLDAGRADSVAV